MKKDIDKEMKALLEKVIARSLADNSFISCFEYFCTEAKGILAEKAGWRKIKLSAGVSSVNLFQGYKDAIMQDIKDGIYKKYSDPAGDIDIRKALAEYYNSYIGGSTYSNQDFCLTTGATGAISSFFEWYAHQFPKNEVLILGPSYYLFKLECKKYKLSYREIIPPVEKKIQEKNTFYNYQYLQKQVTPETKLLVLTNPGNPTGEFLNQSQVEELITFAKGKGLLLLIDSLFLDIPLETGQLFLKNSFVEYGKKQNYLDSIFIVQGWSKNINVPGLRIGYIFSKNSEAISNIISTQEGISFFAPPSNYRSLILLDTYIRFRYLSFGSYKLPKLAENKKTPRQDRLNPILLSNENSGKIFLDFIKYQKSMIKFYKKNRKIGISLLGERIVTISEDSFGFNSLIEIRLPHPVNLFDFSINLFIKTGIKLQSGPYFGFTQKYWEQKNSLWFRFTYAIETKDIREGFQKLRGFIDQFDVTSVEYLKTNLVLE
jgi:aspartate/methionine/tyrosine aminotransferase